ncbi:MAG: 4-hydroxy-tetrahydrodipicolinate reductase [Bacteroidetes bacterium HGW-Bacteroidetes-6]|jgi:4-hydroxy-tetrahydrodipicolinate reductase|nr:MAG: 4-hydroxy-tetrahydrodipicolinate reductase [Bacteroidetes bacterium HGW-Bacteroidetes-6]
MKIFLIGYGKMGKMVEKLAVEAGHSIVAAVDQDQEWPAFDSENHPDVAIEFTRPDVVKDNLLRCIDLKIPVVTGTTGWESHKQIVGETCSQKGGAVLYASNFSIGVNVWLRILDFASKQFAAFNQYRVSVEETHHAAKLDKPSGTAVSAVSVLLNNLPQYHGWSLDAANGEIPVESHRIGTVTGDHAITFQSDVDRIEIVHKALNREGFALGAVVAASWLKDKKGFFDFAELFGDIFSLNNK